MTAEGFSLEFTRFVAISFLSSVSGSIALLFAFLILNPILTPLSTQIGVKENKEGRPINKEKNQTPTLIF